MWKYIKSKNRRGFTLSEAMIAMMVMCTIAIVSAPVIIASRPSTEKVLLKKAYNTTEQVISELAGNERFYPSDISLKDINSTKFQNNNSPSVFLNNSYPPNDAVLEYTIQESFVGNDKQACACYDRAQNKFSVLFCCSLNIVNKHGSTVCTTKSKKTTCDFETVDGIAWHTVDVTPTSTDLTKPVFTITVDVDNKWGGRHLNITSSGYKKTRFVFEVYYDGKIKVDSDAQNILADAISNKRLNY